MKNRFVVMFITFIVMILLTPVIFSKLMNSKFNTMLFKIQQQKGIIIKEIKDKSTYLTTDRIFDVKIPGKILGEKEIKYIELKTEAIFKNLPVTNVEFLNNFEKIVLKNNQTIPLKNIKLLVITPDFKVYKYKLFGSKIKLKNGVLLSWKDFNGVFDYKAQKLQNEDGEVTFQNRINTLVINKINFIFEQNKKSQKEQIHFDLSFKNPAINFSVNNFLSSSQVNINKNKILLISDLNIKEIKSDDTLKISGINSHLKVEGLDKNVFDKLQNKSYTKKDIDCLLKEGFSGEFSVGINKIFFMRNLGSFILNSSFNVKNGSIEKINSNDLSFVNLNLYIKTSPEIINLLSNFFKPIKDLTEIKNNKAVIKIVIKKGKIFINGKEIKSN